MVRSGPLLTPLIQAPPRKTDNPPYCGASTGLIVSYVQEGGLHEHTIGQLRSGGAGNGARTVFLSSAKHKAQKHPGAAKSSLLDVLRGLQFKWTLLLTILLFLIAIAGNMAIRRGTERLIIAREIANAVKRCNQLASLAAAELLSGDRLALDRRAHLLQSTHDLLYVEFYDRTGTLLSARNRGAVAVPPITPPVQSPEQLLPFTERPAIVNLTLQAPRWHAPRQSGPLFLDIAQAATVPSSGPDAVGYMRVGLDLTEAQQRLALFLQQIHWVSIVTIVVLIPFAFMIVRRVTLPLNALNTVVHQLANGDFRVRANIPRGDEIGQLARAFNTMANELSTSNDRLVKLNAELEDRVLQRTRQLKDLAARDSLTGLYNRRHLGEVLTRRFSEAERYGNDMSCMMIDLDNFKKVNDQFGHEMGDNLLILTASVIGSQLRGADVGARFGGDEFCILLPQTSAEQAQQVGQRIVDRFTEELKQQLPEHSTRFGISVGVAGIRELNLVHPDELMKAADQALYNAKEAGKNRIHLAESLST